MSLQGGSDPGLNDVLYATGAVVCRRTPQVSSINLIGSPHAICTRGMLSGFREW